MQALSSRYGQPPETIEFTLLIVPVDARTDHAATSTETRLKLATIRSFCKTGPITLLSLILSNSPDP